MVGINGMSRTQLLLATASLALVGLLVRFLLQGYRVRKRIRRLVNGSFVVPLKHHKGFTDHRGSMARRTLGYGVIFRS